MKANEAPERIWIDPTNDLPKLSGHIDKDSIEYIRTDAFIEKVCDAYCKACIKPSFALPNHLCRRKCKYYDNFLKVIKQ